MSKRKWHMSAAHTHSDWNKPQKQNIHIHIKHVVVVVVVVFLPRLELMGEYYNQISITEFPQHAVMSTNVTCPLCLLLCCVTQWKDTQRHLLDWIQCKNMWHKTLTFILIMVIKIILTTLITVNKTLNINSIR